jgi:NAD(P)-dependent dehydrogenase (short-subunit alcohol dehydrogenase family)
MNKVILVTGAAKRIGKEVALFFYQQGYHVAVHYHQSSEEITLLSQHYPEIFTIQADFNQVNQVVNVVQAVNKALGPIDILINNASYFVNDSIGNITPENFSSHMQINLLAPILLIQEMVKQTNSGNILNILDYSVLTLVDSFLSYNLSKQAMGHLTKTMAVNLAPNFRVNGIAPAAALINPRQTEEKFSKLYCDTPLKRSTNPQEICQAIDFILNTESITGQIIALDGGRHLPKSEYYLRS